jgi:hypothetical protein
MKLPKLWRVKRAGKAIGAWHITWKGERINLATQDAAEALKRTREAVKGKKKFRDDADGAAESLIAAVRDVPQRSDTGGVAGGGGDPASEQPHSSPVVQLAAPPGLGAPPASEPPSPTDSQPPPPASGEWHASLNDAAAASSQQDTPPPPPPELPSDADLAKAGVGFQIWAAETYVRAKVYKGFQAPQIEEEAKEALAAEWEKIIKYAGVGAMMPAWVTALAVPAITIVAASKKMADVFTEQAEQQKAAAGETARAAA